MSEFRIIAAIWLIGLAVRVLPDKSFRAMHLLADALEALS